MTEHTSPGFAAYKRWIANQFVGGSIAPEEMWDAMEISEQLMWEDVAREAIRAAPVPPDALDVFLVNMQATRDHGQDALRVNLEATIPALDRFARSAESTSQALRALGETIGRGVVRLTPVSHQGRESEFQRLQSDGTVRHLEEGEGTW